MTIHRISIIGAGAAGAAAASTLGRSGPEVEVHLYGETGLRPYNRTLVNKGVATGLIEPAQASLPQPNVPVRLDTVSRVDVDGSRLCLASGNSDSFDALIVSTGSTPRHLDPAPTPGLSDALSTGRLNTLHSMADATRVRDALAQTRGQARVVIIGAGLLATETSSLLHQGGHDVHLVARSAEPGTNVVGEAVAARIAELHRTNVTTHFGRTLRSLAVDRPYLVVTLDDHTELTADLVIVAIGTTPAAPVPWPVGSALRVDNRMRHHDSPTIYAAGGVAEHHADGTGAYRIDHWDDATAQGAHAAQAALHDFGLGEDPGPYLARSSYSVRVYGSTLSGAGLITPSCTGDVVSDDPLVVLHQQRDGVPVGVIGIDATPEVHQWAQRLHRTA